MKIALLTYSTKPRGSVVHTWELAEALTDLGHTVCIYA
ncbi:MAG: MSMEG_0565 family glycosyltransferase, partial [Cyanobacteria bacterium J06639_14]